MGKYFTGDFKPDTKKMTYDLALGQGREETSESDSSFLSTKEKERMTKAAPTAMASGGGTIDKLSTLGMMSGNPYLMAAGLGASVLSANAQRKKQAEANQVQAEQHRREQVMGALSRLGSGVGSIG